MDEVAPELAGGMVQTIGPVFKRLAERLTESDLLSLARIALEQEEFLAAWRKWGEVYGLHRDSWILEDSSFVGRLRRLLPITFGKHPVPCGLGFLTHDVSRCRLVTQCCTLA